MLLAVAGVRERGQMQHDVRLHLCSKTAEVFLRGRRQKPARKRKKLCFFAPLLHYAGPDKAARTGNKDLLHLHHRTKNNSRTNTTAQQATDTWNRLAPNQAAAMPTTSAAAPARGL